MRRHAECKNSNSVIYTLSYFPWNFVNHKKQLSMTILYQVLIVQ